MTLRRPIGLAYRLGVAARVAAALAGGYGIAALLSIAAALTLPLPPIEASAAGVIAALLAMPLVAMGCFWARSAARAWTGVLLGLLVLGAIALAAGWRP